MVRGRVVHFLMLFLLCVLASVLFYDLFCTHDIGKSEELQYIIVDIDGASISAKSGIAISIEDKRFIDNKKDVLIKSTAAVNVTIAVTDVGHIKDLTEQVLLLPKEVAVIISPYALEAEQIAKRAAASGHTVLAWIPTEPTNYKFNDSGPYTLLTGFSEAKNLANINAIFGKVNVASGAYIRPNDVYLDDDARFNFFLKYMKAHELFFLCDGVKDMKRIQTVNGTIGANYKCVDVQIDIDATAESIRSHFLQLEEYAKKNGEAIGIIRPYTVSIEELQRWIVSLDAKGIGLKPLLTGPNSVFKL